MSFIFWRRLLALVGLVLCCAVAFGQDDNFLQRIVSFDRHYQKFVNEFCNWPNQEKCVVKSGRYNYAEFRNAREEAKKLFDLTDRK